MGTTVVDKKKQKKNPKILKMDEVYSPRCLKLNMRP